ncbi:Regulator of telomere elongation helicase 1 [Trichoplax sp. H2]|nr:Regulator of telomere elongation helicase 1 [Trichoplax sp. H2]|eukprot:RDD47757.1 Regulator of telomere elongation helicase 1 [Trichoplax sp. H2]
MVLVDVRGIEVDFPFNPYPCQLDYMTNVIQCLQEGKNGILESPTGTGKTLCLLCACLAWRQTYVAQVQLNQRIQMQQLQQNPNTDRNSQDLKEHLQDDISQALFGSNRNDGTTIFQVPKIIYSSRTHSQLSQVVNELKHTIYRPKICILGSREQMCIHPEVAKLQSNTAKIHACRAKVNARTCHFCNNVETKKDDPSFSENILDIEELVELGGKQKVCPYYMARELRSNADIVFMPYNYLIDFKSRQSNSIDMKNAIIICDEAHNLEKICEDSASFDLSSADIANCIDEVDNFINILQRIKSTTDSEEYDATGAVDTDLDVEDLATLKALLLKLEEILGDIELPSSGNGVTKPGSYIYEIFKQLNVTFETKHLFVQVLGKCIDATVSDSKTLRAKHFGLEKVLDILTLIFGANQIDLSSGSSSNSQRYYKVHIRSDNNIRKWQTSHSDPWTTAKKAAKEGRILSYWCFSPSYSMKELIDQEVRAVILTSGTLSPIESLVAEFQVSFPVQLQNPHVIDKKQIWIGTVSKGPCGTALNSSYRNRSSAEYLSSLGNTIVNFARIIPDGLLVFFPSYPVMNSCIEHWQSSGIWDRICQHKSLHIEPQHKSEFNRVMDEYYSSVRDENCSGAIFLGVCRGKVSEGVDFADINGRAVIITGLPFPPSKEAKVMLKMQYLDENIGFKEHKSICGRDWYRQQASRAVNQAIGRVIRHRNDYGAIILCDERFNQKDSISQLPKWLKDYVQAYGSFGLTQKSLKDFFSTAMTLGREVSSEKAALKHSNAEIAKNLSRPFKKPTSSEKNAKDVVLHVASLQPTVPKSPNDRKAAERLESRKQTSLLESLNQCDENRITDTVPDKNDTATISSTILDENLSNVDAKINAMPVAKRTHKIILHKKGTNSGNRENTAAMYLKKVKECLSVDSFARLRHLLASFKKDRNIHALINGLSTVFDDSSMYDLAIEFVQFIPGYLKEEFETSLRKKLNG